MSPMEVTGFIFGVAGVWLTIKEHWTCFPVGLINVTISLFLFINQKLYSDALQQFVYIILLSYGWYQWKNHFVDQRPTISWTTSQMKITLIVLFLVFSSTMGFFFDRFTDADVPYIDAIATGMSFIAQFLIARKKIENWLIWVFVNILYIGIYAYKELYLYMLLFFIYFTLSIVGFYSWKKEMLTQKTIHE